MGLSGPRACMIDGPGDDLGNKCIAFVKGFEQSAATS